MKYDGVELHEILNQKGKVIAAMTAFGSPFIKKLAETLSIAGVDDTVKIFVGFSSYWEIYLDNYITHIERK